MNEAVEPYSIPLKTIDGREITLDDFRGQVLLIVNVASRCGFTPQYEGLQTLWEKYRDRGLVVLGFPCNQFGLQEPGDEAKIQDFCSTAFGVTFPMFSKIEVNGSDTHPLYDWLKNEAPGALGTRAIKWNFTKFLVGRDGRVVDRYASTTSPEKLEETIVALLDDPTPDPAGGHIPHPH